MKTVKLNFFLLNILTVSLLISCGKGGQQQEILRGNSTILTDEAFFPIVSAEQEVYTHFYKEANLQVEIAHQEDAVEKLLKGETESIVVSRLLSEEEMRYLEKQNVQPEIFKFASDELVFIAKASIIDSVLEKSAWNDFTFGKRTLVTESPHSSAISFLSDTLNLKDSIHMIAAGSMEKVVEAVTKDPAAVGVISLSVYKDSYMGRKDIKLLGVRNDSGEITYPFQEDLALVKYPFQRPVYLINRYKAGLGTGFASYILGDDGQRIVLKSGLLPAEMPGRDVILKEEL